MQFTGSWCDVQCNICLWLSCAFLHEEQVADDIWHPKHICLPNIVHCSLPTKTQQKLCSQAACQRARCYLSHEMPWHMCISQCGGCPLHAACKLIN